MLAPMQSYCVLFFLTLVVVTTFAGDLRCLRPGAPVISLYKDNRYFPGRLDGLGESIDVTFQNGQQQTYTSYTNDVIVDDVPDISELVGGSRVLARRPSSISFEPGFVNGSIEGVPLNDTFLVNYDSGDSIARNIQDIRLAVKPRSCMNEKGIYIGCFENVVNNFLTNYYPVNPTDVATCNWACFTRGFSFAGLQNGTWCFCGNHVNDSLKVDDTDCNIACRDSREDVCGGYQRMTVYWTGADYNNRTNDLSEFTAGEAGEASSSKDMLKSDLTSENACADLYDSSQCNTWADQSKCIENPDWMIANCKKSCYACSYNEDKPSSSVQGNAPVTSPPPQSNAYQSSVGYQAPSSYPQSSYPTSQDSSTQSSKKSDHPALDKTSNTPGYLGCFRDSPTTHDLEYLADIRPLSIRGCVTKCKSMRFPYAGVQSSSSCYCGLHYGKYGQLEHEDCNTPCEGDASEMCGGLFKNSLFHTGFPVKFKTTENPLTRKDLPSSSLARNNMAAAGAYPPNPSYNYPSQYPQTSYPQRSYTKPVYPQPASSYTQASMPAYPSRPYTQTNAYQPTYPYNNQASGPMQSGSTNAVARDFSPADSSSYRWRETYVKLRQQEQERYSKPSITNLRKLSKLAGNAKPENSENSIKRNYPKNDKIDSAKFQNLGNNAQTIKETEQSSTKPTSSVSQSMYKQFMSQMYKNYKGSKSGHKKKILRKTSKLRHKQVGKPGIFLRKKASKKNSFLAFLPHEVTEDESLLENVYNMLSVMLTNLKKHKKSSLKNLKKYLKFSPSDEEDSRVARKTSLRVSDHPKSVDSSKKHAEKQKLAGVKTHKSHEQGRKLEDGASLQHRKGAQNHISEGQKQLSKPHEVSDPKIQAMSYPPRSGPAMRQDTNTSLETTNGNSGYKNTISNEAKSSVNLNKNDARSLFANAAMTHHNDEARNVSSNTLQEQTKLPSQSHSISKDKYNPEPRVKGKTSSTAKNVFQHQANTSKIQEQINTFEHKKPEERRFQNKLATTDADRHQGDGLKKVAAEMKYPKENSKKSGKGKLASSKTGGEAKLKLDRATARNKTNADNTVEKSDDEIISTIVDMLEKEKAMRNNTRDEQSKQNDSKTKQRKNTEKRNNKTGSKRSKFTKHQRKRKAHTNRNEMKATKRIYKKDHMGRVSGTDDNLMMEDEDYRENIGMTDE